MTITEALAEVKTVNKRIAKKREFVLGFLYRQERMKDPLEKEGGSRAALQRERQAIADLEARVVDLRRAITLANQRTEITVGGRTMSIYDWLTWRREVAGGTQEFLNQMRNRLLRARMEATQKGVAMVAEPQNDTDVVVNVNEKELADQAEALEETLGTLDGLLSLKNATVSVEI